MKQSLGVVIEPPRNESQTSISFSTLVVLISDYIATTARALQHSPNLPQAQIRVRLLAVTLASTRLRTKLALDALNRFSDQTRHIELRPVVHSVSEVLGKLDERLAREPSVEKLIHRILQVDQELIQVFQGQGADNWNSSEELGQLVMMVTMMRRACFFIFSTAR